MTTSPEVSPSISVDGIINGDSSNVSEVFSISLSKKLPDLWFDETSPSSTTYLLDSKDSECDEEKMMSPSPTISQAETIDPVLIFVEAQMRMFAEKICSDLGHQFTIRVDANVGVFINNGERERKILSSYHTQCCDRSSPCTTSLTDVDIC